MATDAKVTIYGAGWCSMTRHALSHLDRLKVPYRYVDVDEDPEASAWVVEQNGDGKERKPTLDVDGRVLVRPSDRELESALREGGLLG